MRRLFIYQHLICLVFIIPNTDKHEVSSICKWISCCNDVMNYVDCVIKCDVYPQKMHYLPLDGMINIHIYLVWERRVQLNSTQFYLQITQHLKLDI